MLSEAEVDHVAQRRKRGHRRARESKHSPVPRLNVSVHVEESEQPPRNIQSWKHAELFTRKVDRESSRGSQQNCILLESVDERAVCSINLDRHRPSFVKLCGVMGCGRTDWNSLQSCDMESKMGVKTK